MLFHSAAAEGINPTYNRNKKAKIRPQFPKPQFQPSRKPRKRLPAKGNPGGSACAPAGNAIPQPLKAASAASMPLRSEPSTEGMFRYSPARKRPLTSR
mgnify:CR=1 FL=1